MRTHQPDYILVSLIIILLVFGLVVLASASVVISQENFQENYHFLKHQLFYSLAVGLIAFLVCQRIDYRYWQKIAFFLLIASIIILSLVFVPGLGGEQDQARRWIYLGPFSFQPFELVKLTFIIYLAAVLSRPGRNVQRIIRESLVPFSIFFAAIAGLVISQPNFSALSILVLLALVIYFLAGIKIWHLLIGGSICLAGLSVLVKTSVYRTDRLMVFLHPELDPQGIGYQINQAVLAISSGGLWGLGLGHSVQKWKYLPEPIGDSIFAITAEELGLIGGGLMIILFVFLAIRGLKIARRAPNRFGYLLAGGVTSWLIIQVFINIATISGIIPLTGLPLPLVSYGGSAMIANLAGLGILVNISKHTSS